MLVAEKRVFFSENDFNGKPMTYKSGEVIVLLDVITSQAVQDQMVTIKAADISDALASKGFFDLYGVYFDTDKTEVKPESNAMLD